MGKEVCFILDPKTVGNKKEYGLVFLGKGCASIMQKVEKRFI